MSRDRYSALRLRVSGTAENRECCQHRGLREHAHADARAARNSGFGALRPRQQQLGQRARRAFRERARHMLEGIVIDRKIYDEALVPLSPGRAESPAQARSRTLRPRLPCCHCRVRRTGCARLGHATPIATVTTVSADSRPGAVEDFSRTN